MVLILFPEEWLREIWNGETRSIIFLALIATFMQGTVWPIACQMGEADRKTYEIQRLNTVIVLIHLIAILVLWYFGQLALPSIFFLLFIEWSLAALIGYRLYEVNTENQIEKAKHKDTFFNVFMEFYEYCLPFIPYAFFSFAHDFGDRWMLQKWGGSNEQAFYTISYQFATISLIGTTSVLKIFWKEIAEAHQNSDQEKVRILFMKIMRGLYFLGAVSAGALIPWTSEIINIMLGEQYTGAYFTMLLMFNYQCYLPLVKQKFRSNWVSHLWL
jgi:O-antigen/teichoic acid export membrane protein